MSNIMSDSYYSTKLQSMPLSDSFQYSSSFSNSLSNDNNNNNNSGNMFDNINRRLATEETIIEMLKSNYSAKEL